MSTITRNTIYPQNGTTNATTINADFDAITTATSDLNEKNVRQEGMQQHTQPTPRGDTKLIRM
jgi:hypothetical protein